MAFCSKYLSTAGRIGMILLYGVLMQSCLYMLEKKNDKLKNINKADIREAFSNGSRTLPVVFLETEGHNGINNKEYWKDAELDIYTVQGHTKEEVEIKGRGNSTWTFPKKPFNIKYDSKHSFMGLPKATKFCALANWRDRTRIRNAVALEIARQTSMEWTPQGIFADLVVDGDWYGNFYFTEKVEPEKLNLGKHGYIVFVDDHYDKTYRFHSKIKGLPVNIIVEDNVALDAKAFDEIKATVDGFESALYHDTDNWLDRIDLQSFCDWFIVHELTGTDEPSDPKGIYMYCRGDGVLHAGPCWDFDYHTFRPGVKGLVNGNALWFGELLKRPEFKFMLKKRWAAIKPLIENRIPAYMDKLYDDLKESLDLDHQIWPYKIIKTNGDERMSLADAVARMKRGFSERIAELDNYCNKL